MGLERKSRIKNAQLVKSEAAHITATLDGTTTSEIVPLNMVGQKATFQMSGTLVGTVEFSIDGEQWNGSTAIGAAGVLVSYSTHNFSAMKVTRSSGSGKLAIAVR